MKIYNFINEKGGRAVLKAIDGPPAEWDSPIAAFEAGYAHEQKVTGLINGLVELSMKEKDFASNIMLQWFVEEQVEEEASVDEVVQLLKRAENASGALFMIDRELGARVFTGGALTPSGE
jgi:ferritin